MKSKKKIVALFGPTASGKSLLALHIFKDIPSAIINCDSQQVYRDLPIGTAQPTEEDKNIVPHFLYGFVESGKQYSAGEYEKKADICIADVIEHNKLPVVVGGSGLYLNALLVGLDDLPEKNKSLRRELEERIKKEGLPSLYTELKNIDYEYARIISENDSVRIIRAIEIYRLSGIKLSRLRGTKKSPKYDAFLIGLNVNRDLLYKRINNRVITMLENGWIEETKKIIEKGGKNWLYHFPGIGYRYIIDYLDNKVKFDEMCNLIQRDTRRYAKRQYTWFRKIQNVHWVEYNKESDSKNIQSLIWSQLQRQYS